MQAATPHTHAVSVTTESGNRAFMRHGILRVVKVHDYNGATYAQMSKVALDEAHKIAEMNKIPAFSFEALPIGLVEVDVVVRDDKGTVAAIFYLENKVFATK